MRTLKIMSRNLKELYVHEFDFQFQLYSSQYRNQRFFTILHGPWAVNYQVNYICARKSKRTIE